MLKPFTRIIERNGSQYVNEVTPYYDENGKVRQHVKYLGKMVNGKIEKVRLPMHRRTFAYGEILLVNHAMRDLQLDDGLLKLLPTEKARCVMALAMGRVLEGCALGNTNLWYEGTILHRNWGHLPLSASAISELLVRLGESSVSEDFSDWMLRRFGSGAQLLFDVSAFSSYSEQLELVEYGRKYGETKLPQVNLSLIAHKELGIPLSIRAYPGSIPDVSMLQGEVERLEALGLKAPTMIMDRGFHSQPNLDLLNAHGLDFIMPASEVFKEVRSLISRESRGMDQHCNYGEFEDCGYYVQHIELGKEHKVDGFLFHDPLAEANETANLHRRLEATMQKLVRLQVPSYRRPDDVFRETARDLANFFSYRLQDGRFIVSVKEKAVAQAVNRHGRFILLYSGHLSWQECLSWYRERDGVEKIFKTLKHDLAGEPLRVQSREGLIGGAFINFLALAMRCRLQRMMRGCDLCQKHSLPALILEMQKMRAVELADGRLQLDQTTKKQDKAMQALNISSDALCVH
jgi:transposase